uniref:Candidate secreted effector n=1 Tax=Meloidogyne incognita TaxID=6306 RepID=A0A914NNS6_MELIC
MSEFTIVVFSNVGVDNCRVLNCRVLTCHVLNCRVVGSFKCVPLSRVLKCRSLQLSPQIYLMEGTVCSPGCSGEGCGLCGY